MMKRWTVQPGVTAWALVAWTLAAWTWAVLPAAAEMSDREVRKTLKQADRDWQAGHTDAAVEAYTRVLDATEEGDTRRGGALYAVALAALDQGELERARSLFQELGDSASPAQQMVVRAVGKLLEDTAGFRAAEKRAAELLAAQQAALEKERLQQQERDRTLAELREKLAAAEARVAELAAAQEEEGGTDSRQAKALAKLAECEEKLEKVRKSLLDRSGG